MDKDLARSLHFVIQASDELDRIKQNFKKDKVDYEELDQDITYAMALLRMADARILMEVD